MDKPTTGPVVGKLPLDGRGGRRKLSAEEVIECRLARSQGATAASLAKHYGVHPNTVWSLVNGRTYKDVQACDDAIIRAVRRSFRRCVVG